MCSLDGRRAFGRWFLVAVAACFFLYVNAVSYAFSDSQGEAWMLFEFAAAAGYVSPALPLLAALPYAASFCADYRSGYTLPLVLRAGRRRYLLSKILFAAVAGGLGIALGALLFIALIYLRFPLEFPAPIEFLEMEGLQALLSGGDAGAYFAYYAARLLLLGLSGAFWATLALTFSAFYVNAPMTYCAPLVGYRLIQELCARLGVPDAFNVTIVEEGMSAVTASGALAAGILTPLFGILLLAALFIWRAGRRIRYE